MKNNCVNLIVSIVYVRIGKAYFSCQVRHEISCEILLEDLCMMEILQGVHKLLISDCLTPACLYVVYAWLFRMLCIKTCIMAGITHPNLAGSCKVQFKLILAAWLWYGTI